MPVSEGIESNPEQYKICIIIPTFNNADTITSVIDDVLKYCTDIIIVNDGSTDNTISLLAPYQNIQLVSYNTNRGKGYALRTGFKHAMNNGYEYAITIDADGQHFASDIPAFIKKLEEGKDAVITGAREMDIEGQPGKSKFANKFSNFWFRVETGKKHPDTQSGFRLYPLKDISRNRWYGTKYEFEIEVLVRLSWSGITITDIPIDVYYPPESERVSHFRPLPDFTRISILNTILVLIAFFYIKPRDSFRKLFSKSIKQHFREQVSNPKYSNLNLALSVALGIFMGIVPLWGYQMVVAVFLAYVLRLNKVIVLIFSNISIPPMIPVILYLSVKAGEMVTGVNTNIHHFNDLTIKKVMTILAIYIPGSIALALASGIIAGIISLVILTIARKTGHTKNVNKAMD